MSNTHTFAPGAEQLIVDLVPPTGATAVTIAFTATMPTAPGPAGGVRLAHVRLLHPTKHPNQNADAVLPRESEVCELIFRNGVPTAGFSGFGGRHAGHQVQHMGAAPAIFPVVITIPLGGKSVSISAGAHTAISDTDLVPGGAPMQLLLGMAPLAHGDGVNTLSPPMGWVFTWEDDAVRWLTGTGVGAPSGSNAPAPPAAHPVLDVINAELAKRSNLDPAEQAALTAILAKLFGGL